MNRNTDNHSIAYCLLGYLCAYYRCYHPVEFITAFLNNAANDDDIKNGALLAHKYGIKISSPKFGISRGEYSCDSERKVIAKGLSSVKFIGDKLADSLYDLSKQQNFELFTDVLMAAKDRSVMDSRQLGILIHIDFFDMFGNQGELENVVYFWTLFKEGEAKQIARKRVEGSRIESIVQRFGNDKTKDGKEAASYKLQNVPELIRECERAVMQLGIPDAGVVSKSRYFKEAMGYAGYTSNKEEDRCKLYVKSVLPLKRKSDGKQFGYSVVAQSVGSGIETRYTVFNRVYNEHPIREGDFIRVISWTREKGQYFTLSAYKPIRSDYDTMDELEDEMSSC